MPEENQAIPATPENNTNFLDKNVPNPLAKNPNVHTHKVFASVGLVLIGVIIILSILGYFYRDQVADFFNENTGTANTEKATKSSISSEFSDKTIGVAFKIPIEWELYSKDFSNNPDDTANRINFVDKETKKDNLFSLYSAGPYDEIYNTAKVEKVGVSKTEIEGADTITSTRLEDIQLDGSNALVFESINKNKQDPLNIYEMRIYFQKDGTSGMLQIRTDETSPEFYAKNKEKLLNVIVPNFRFLD